MRYRVLVIAVVFFILCPAAWSERGKNSEQYTIDSIHVQGDTTYAIPVAKPFTKGVVQSNINDILQPFYNSGYYYTTAKPENLTFGANHTINMTITVTKGPRVRVANQIYLGLNRSNKTVISKYLPAHSGDSLTDDILQDITASAQDIGFVRFIPPVMVQPQEGYMTADLALRFEEKQPVTLALGGGYIPGDATGLVWHINLTLNNLFGGGRYASLLSERRERGRNRLELGYRQPLFLIGVGELQANVATRDYRDEYYEFAMQAGYTARIKQKIASSLSLGLRSVEPATTQPSYAVYTVKYGVNWQRLDNRFNPRSGMSLGWTIGYSYRRYRIDTTVSTIPKSSYNETHTSLNLKWYHQLFANVVGHLGVTYKGLETGESLPPLSELILVGGPGTLRGFRNEQFAVLRAVIGTIEPRYRFTDGYMFLFYDAAYLNNRIPDEKDSVRTDEQYQYGYGVGLALYSGNKYLKLSLGWNKELAFDSPRLSIELVTDL